MTETTSTPDPAATAQPDDATAKPETDWKAEARKWEQRAKENRDAADRLAALEDAQKSETQRLTERAEKAEKALAGVTVDRDRLSVVLAKGLDPELAPLLSGASKEDIEKQADLLASRMTATTPKPPARELRSGASGKSDNDSAKARAAAALRQLSGSDH